MRDVLFKKRINKKNQTKVMCICQKKHEKECSSYIRKGFLYTVSKTEQVNPQLEPPEINIIKSFDSKNKIEKFQFNVRGEFYITHERMLLKVTFHHSLNIKIIWNKDFSPKKSVVLT